MSKAHKWNAPDTVTTLRMVGTLCLAFVELETLGFFAVYTITGLTDVLDGWLARKTGTESDFGAKLDSMCAGVRRLFGGTGDPSASEMLLC